MVKEIGQTAVSKDGVYTNFGGVTIRNEFVANKKVIQENGSTRYVVNFTSGAIAKYPAQSAKNNAQIEHFPIESNVDKNNKTAHTDVYRIWGLEFTGVKGKEDYVHLAGCRNSKIDIADNGTKDVVQIDDNKYNGKTFLSKGNSITKDKKDEVGVFTALSGNTYYTDGSTVSE